MSLDKSIAHGKERRKPYRGSKAIDPSCRNHGGCPWCEENRKHKFRDKEKDYHGRLQAEERMNMDIIINNFTMPDCCADCPFKEETEGYCLADRERRNTNDDPCERAWWCPLEYAMIVDTF